jgi:hypothetical protein
MNERYGKIQRMTKQIQRMIEHYVKILKMTK